MSDESISLRDHFAAAALKGLLVGHGKVANRTNDGIQIDADRVDAIAWSAYRYADAMLNARQQPNEAA